jgi:hypothetical protein
MYIYKQIDKYRYTFEYICINIYIIPLEYTWQAFSMYETFPYIYMYTQIYKYIYRFKYLCIHMIPLECQ